MRCVERVVCDLESTDAARQSSGKKIIDERKMFLEGRLHLEK